MIFVASKRDYANGDSVEMLGSRTAKRATSIFIARILTLVVLGASYIFITRLLGPSNYGIYTLAIATSGFFGAFGDFGMATTLVKRISEYLSKGQMGLARDSVIDSFALMFIESAAFSILAFLLSGFVSQYVLHNAVYTHLLQLASLTIVLGTLWTAGYSSMYVFSRSKQIVGTIAAQNIIQGAAGVGFIFLGFGPASPIMGLVLSYVVGIIASIYFLTRQFKISITQITFRFKKWREIFTSSALFGVSNSILGLINNYSILFLGFYSAVLIVGNFGAAYKVINVFDTLLGSIGFAVLPLFSVVMSNSKASKKAGEYYNHSIYFAFLFAAPIVFYIILLSNPLTNTVFGGVYSTAPTYISIMALGALITIIGTYATNLLIGAGKMRSIFKYNITIVLVQLVLLYLIVPTFSAIGLTVLMFIVMPIITNILYMRRAAISFNVILKITPLAKLVAAAIVSALFIVPLLLFISGNTLLLLVAAALEQLAIYPALIALFGAIDIKKIKMLKEFTGGIPVISALVSSIADYSCYFIRGA